MAPGDDVAAQVRRHEAEALVAVGFFEAEVLNAMRGCELPLVLTDHFQQNTLRDAMVAALSFGVFHRHTEHVKMANVPQALVPAPYAAAAGWCWSCRRRPSPSWSCRQPEQPLRPSRGAPPGGEMRRRIRTR